MPEIFSQEPQSSVGVYERPAGADRPRRTMMLAVAAVVALALALSAYFLLRSTPAAPPTPTLIQAPATAPARSP